MKSNRGQSDAQRRAVTNLAARLGAPVYVNDHDPRTALWVDFADGTSWRIEPDGTAQDCTTHLQDQF